MCKREHVQKAQEAQDAAAEALARACRGYCSNDLGAALTDLYSSALNEPIPDDIARLVDRLQ